MSGLKLAGAGGARAMFVFIFTLIGGQNVSPAGHAVSIRECNSIIGCENSEKTG